MEKILSPKISAQRKKRKNFERKDRLAQSSEERRDLKFTA